MGGSAVLENLWRRLKGRIILFNVMRLLGFAMARLSNGVDVVIVLVAWCELRKAFRHFRIDRIEQCEPTGVVFTGRGEAMLVHWERVQWEQGNNHSST